MKVKNLVSQWNYPAPEPDILFRSPQSNLVICRWYFAYNIYTYFSSHAYGSWKPVKAPHIWNELKDEVNRIIHCNNRELWGRHIAQILCKQNLNISPALQCSHLSVFMIDSYMYLCQQTKMPKTAKRTMT